MSGSEVLTVVASVVAGAAAFPVLGYLSGKVTVNVGENEVALVTSFGKLVRSLSEPGLHVVPTVALPWAAVHHVSLRRDFRQLSEVRLLDVRGTTLFADLWVEFRIVDPVKATFGVVSWETGLQSLLANALIALASERELLDIVREREALADCIRDEVGQVVARWGLHIERVLVPKLRLTDEVEHQILGAIAARLERATAAIEEQGRIEVALLEARTEERVAKLLADAKVEYVTAVAGALAPLQENPQLERAFDTLHYLSLVDPTRVVAYRGFESLTPTDAAELERHR